MKRNQIVSMLFRGTMLCLLLAVFVSCAEDPAEKDPFVGTYQGKLSYSHVVAPGEATPEKPNKKIKVSDGKVTITKEGSKYNFFFSHEIPAIRNIELDSQTGKFSGSIGTAGASLIVIKDGHLSLEYIKGALNEVWTADCQKL